MREHFGRHTPLEADSGFSLRRVLLLIGLSIACWTCQEREVVKSFPDSFVGVGLELKIQKGVPLVVRPIKGGSAADAGILARDRIIAIDGQPTEGLSLGDVVMRLRGEPDTQVTMTVHRNGHQLIVAIKRKRMAKVGKDYR